MLILEIAAGIVLGFIALALWPYVLALCVIGVVLYIGYWGLLGGAAVASTFDGNAAGVTFIYLAIGYWIIRGIIYFVSIKGDEHVGQD